MRLRLLSFALHTYTEVHTSVGFAMTPLDMTGCTTPPKFSDGTLNLMSCYGHVTTTKKQQGKGK